MEVDDGLHKKKEEAAASAPAPPTAPPRAPASTPSAASRAAPQAAQPAAVAPLPAEPAPPTPRLAARMLKGILSTVLLLAIIGGCIVGAQWYLFRRVSTGTVVDHPVVLAGSAHVVQAGFAPDGRSLLAVMSDGTLQRFSLPELGKPSPVDLGTKRRLRRVRFLAGGRVFVPEWQLSPLERQRRERPGMPPLSWIEDLMLRGNDPDVPVLYDSVSGKRLGVLEEGRGVDRLVASPDGIYLAAIKEKEGQQEVLLWDQRGRLKQRFHVEDHIIALAFHPIDEMMAWQHPAKQGSVVTFHDLSTGETKRTLKTSATGPLLSFSPDGQELAVGSKTLELWDVKWERSLMLYPSRPPLEDVVFDRGGKRMLLITSQRPGLHLYRTLGRDAHQPSAPFLGDWISPDWKTVGTLEKGVITIREAVSGRVRGRLVPQGQQAVLGFSAKGNRFATAEDPGVVRIWDLPTHKVLESAQGPRGRVLAISNDWTTAVTQTEKGYVVWSFPEGSETRTFTPDRRYWWTFIQLAPDQQQLLFARRAEDGSSTAIAWDPKDGTSLQVLAPWTVASAANVVGMGSGGIVAASTSEQWQAYSDAERAQLWEHEAPEAAVRILADAKGEEFFFVGRRRVYKVKARSGEAESSFAHDGALAPPNAHVAALTPDGHMLATAETESAAEIAVWESGSGKRLATLRGHTMPPLDMGFSPDGHWLVSVGTDGQLLLWELPVAAKKSGH